MKAKRIGATSPHWTQVPHGQRYKFQNPLHQNRKHEQTVAKLLDFLEPGPRSWELRSRR